jgi:hypothetical protein
MCSASHMADVETIIQLVPNFVHSVPSDGCKCILSARISCTRNKWILGWVVPCVIVCEMHSEQLLQTLSSLTAEHTNSSVVGWPFSKLVASSGGAQQQSPGSFKKTLSVFLSTGACVNF